MNEVRLFNDLFDLDPMEGPMRSLLRPWRVEAVERITPKIRIDLTEDAGAYLLKADIPGVAKDDIEVRIDGRQVTLGVEVKREEQSRHDGERVLRSERRYGYASRSFVLDSTIDEAKAEAHYRNGVLELRLPKKTGTAVGRTVAVSG